MSYFLDTSALTKIYHREDGSDELLKIYNQQDEITISELAKVEFYSTIHRKFREKEIDIKTLNHLIERFEYDVEHRFEMLIFSSGVTEQAKNLLLTYGQSKSIRALDSLQLSFFTFYCEKSDIFVCSDIKLVKVAQEEDLKVLLL